LNQIKFRKKRGAEKRPPNARAEFKPMSKFKSKRRNPICYIRKGARRELTYELEGVGKNTRKVCLLMAPKKGSTRRKERASRPHPVKWFQEGERNLYYFSYKSKRDL